MGSSRSLWPKLTSAAACGTLAISAVTAMTTAEIADHRARVRADRLEGAVVDLAEADRAGAG
jgi:hypothetical protein